MNGSLNGGKHPYPTLLLVLAALLLFAPLAIFHYFPNQDGPVHVSSAMALMKLRDASSFLHGYFHDSGNDITNWVTAFVFEHMPGFIPVDRYEAAFAALYLATLIVASILTTRYILKVDAPAALIFLPFAYTHMLHMGSFNLSMAIAPFIVLLGVCHSYLLRPTFWKALAVAALSLLTFSIHVQVSLVALTCVGLYSVWAMLAPPVEQNKANVLSQNRFFKGAALALAGFPLFCACLAFALLNKAGGLPSMPQYPGLLMRFVHLGLLSGVASYSVFGLGVAMLLALGLAISTAAGVRRIAKSGMQQADCLLLCAAVTLAVFLVLPNGYTDTFNIEERLMPPLLAILATWLVLRVYPIAPPPLVLTLVFGVIALQTVDRAVAFHKSDAALADYAEIAKAVPDKAALFVVNLEQIALPPQHRSLSRPFDPALRFDPYRIFIGTALGDRDVAMLSNYQAQTVRPYFALKYNPWLASIITGREPASPEAMELRTGALTTFFDRLKTGEKPVTHVVVWRADLENNSDPRIAAAVAALRKHCERSATSPSGRVELCRITQ